MLAWAVRRRESWIRCPLVLMLFPLFFIPQLVVALRNKRAFEFEYWDNNWAVFWAAYEGAFIND